MNRLLIINNNRLTTMKVRDALYLEAPHVQIFEASSEKEALTIAFEIRPDMILVDVNNSLLQTSETAQQLRKLPQMQSIPIIGITPVRLLKENAAKVCAICDEWLSYPISSNELLSLISQYY